MKISKIAEHIGARLEGTIDGEVYAVRPTSRAGKEDITFAGSKKHRGELADCQAGAVIVDEPVEGFNGAQLVVDNVDKGLIGALKLLGPKLTVRRPGIDSTAKVADSAQVSEKAYIGPNVVIEENVEIGDDCVIESGCKVGENSRMGRGCRLDSNVVVYHNCRLGDGVIIQSNTTIGATGFGYAQIEGRSELIPHNGGVVIEDYVEIGSNSCVDRAKFDNTVIGAGTKVDNLVQIGHNVEIGRCCLIAGQAGMGGSTTLGDGVILGGQSGIVDNVAVSSGCMLGAKATIMNDITKDEKLLGTPAVNAREYLRSYSYMRRLGKMWKDLKDLALRVRKLEATKDNK